MLILRQKSFQFCTRRLKTPQPVCHSAYLGLQNLNTLTKRTAFSILCHKMVYLDSKPLLEFIEFKRSSLIHNAYCIIYRLHKSVWINDTKIIKHERLLSFPMSFTEGQFIDVFLEFIEFKRSSLIQGKLYKYCYKSSCLFNWHLSRV